MMCDEQIENVVERINRKITDLRGKFGICKMRIASYNTRKKLFYSIFKYKMKDRFSCLQ